MLWPAVTFSELLERYKLCLVPFFNLKCLAVLSGVWKNTGFYHSSPRASLPERVAHLLGVCLKVVELCCVAQVEPNGRIGGTDYLSYSGACSANL